MWRRAAFVKNQAEPVAVLKMAETGSERRAAGEEGVGVGISWAICFAGRQRVWWRRRRRWRRRMAG